MSATPPPPPPPAAVPNPGEAKNGLGVWALVLGILSIVCCGFFAGVPAIILGMQSKAAGEQGLASNGNLGQIGFILGIVGSALSVIGIFLNFVLAPGLLYSF